MLIVNSLVAATMIVTVQAKTWATGDCTLDSGEKFFYAIHQSKGFMSFEDGKQRDVFSTREEKNGLDLGIIRHIGSEANLTLVVNLDTGRGYLVVRNDNGRKVEGNAYCVMKSVRR